MSFLEVLKQIAGVAAPTHEVNDLPNNVETQQHSSGPHEIPHKMQEELPKVSGPKLTNERFLFESFHGIEMVDLNAIGILQSAEIDRPCGVPLFHVPAWSKIWSVLPRGH
jgi:hypothetical protein